MKRTKLMGLSLLAIFAVAAFAAATATAEEGFLPTQTSGNALGGKSTLNAGGLSIVCSTLDESPITFSNDKTGEGTLHWLGCKAAGLFAAKSLGATGSEEILAKVKFLVCLDAKNGTTLVDNFGVAGEVVGKLHLEVPATGTLTIITGTALGAVLTSGKAQLWSMEFLGAKGVQTITSCMQGTTTLTHNLLTEENENGKPTASSENVEGGLLQFGTAVELMDS